MSDVVALARTIIESRGTYEDLDGLMEYLGTKYPTIDKQLMLEMAVEMEKALTHKFRPVNLLDFNTELTHWYNKLKSLSTELESGTFDMSDKEILQARTKLFDTSQKYIKTIMEAHDRIADVKKIQDMMDFVVGIMKEYDPEIREKIMRRLLGS